MCSSGNNKTKSDSESVSQGLAINILNIVKQAKLLKQKLNLKAKVIKAVVATPTVLATLTAVVSNQVHGDKKIENDSHSTHISYKI